MTTEIEVKFLNIHPDSFRKILKEKGAKLIHSERLMRRMTFDYPDARLEKVGGWVRVRDESDRVTLSYKQLIDRTIKGTKEILVTVDDLEKTCDLLAAIGLKNKSYQETKREEWLFDGVEITIDTWPWIPTFVELEGATEKAIKEAVAKLGLNWSNALHGSVENAYRTYYDITEEEIDNTKKIVFTSVPQWLKARRKVNEYT